MEFVFQKQYDILCQIKLMSLRKINKAILFQNKHAIDM